MLCFYKRLIAMMEMKLSGIDGIKWEGKLVLRHGRNTGAWVAILFKQKLECQYFIYWRNWKRKGTTTSKIEYGEVLRGDWNYTICFIIDRNGEEQHSHSGASLSNIVGKCDLIDVWRRRNIRVRCYTWIKVTGNMVSGARLDRFYLSKMVENIG